VDDSTQWAQQAGITGVPGIVLDGRMLISGVVPREHLDEAVRALRENPAEQG
jgi:predicted DsbA family dithiol-disulfide isomerase